MENTYLEENRSVHLAITNFEFFTLERFVGLFECELEQFNDGLVGVRMINKKKSIFKISYKEGFENNSHKIFSFLKEKKTFPTLEGDLEIEARRPPKPRTNITLFPVPVEITGRHLENSVNTLGWGRYVSHTFLTHKNFKHLYNGYMILTLEDFCPENVTAVAKIYGHSIQVAKPGESFGPFCNICKTRGHWASRCPKKDTCNMCGQPGHRGRWCPNLSQIKKNEEHPISLSFETAFPRLPRRSTPKGDGLPPGGIENLSPVLEKIDEREKRRENLNKKINLIDFSTVEEEDKGNEGDVEEESLEEEEEEAMEQRLRNEERGNEGDVEEGDLSDEGSSYNTPKKHVTDLTSPTTPLHPPLLSKTTQRKEATLQQQNMGENNISKNIDENINRNKEQEKKRKINTSKSSEQDFKQKKKKGKKK